MPPTIQSFTYKYDKRTNVLFTDVLVAQAFDPIKTPKSQYPPGKNYRAIWDTGATNTVISPRVVSECSLKPIGMVNMNTANGVLPSHTYLINMILPNKAGFSNVKVSESEHIVGNFDLLVGMDIIGAGDFAVTHHDGKTTFSYRTPSHQCIDFVQDAKQPPVAEPVRHTGPKVGRNDPCPCNSGKKYKKCCGRGV